MTDTQRHIQAAVGFIQLGMLDEAADELEEIEPRLKTRPEVLGLRIEIFRRLEKWEDMATIAKYLVREHPDNPEWILDLAYATRRSESVLAAQKILLKAEAKHPEESVILFNLACYACQLGDLEEAKERLKRAISLDGSWRAVALDDPDLDGVWAADSSAVTPQRSGQHSETEFRRFRDGSVFRWTR